MKKIKKELFRMRITTELKAVMVQAATEQGKTLTDLITDFLLQIASKRNEKTTFGT